MLDLARMLTSKDLFAVSGIDDRGDSIKPGRGHPKRSLLSRPRHHQIDRVVQNMEEIGFDEVEAELARLALRKNQNT